MEINKLFIATIITILVNLSSNIKKTSDKNMIDITPLPLTFSIWPIIYGLLLYTTYRDSKDMESIATLFYISCILNCMWLYTWGKSTMLAGLILILLTSIIIYITSYIGTKSTSKLLLYTFAIYATWLFIASILNISIILIKNNIMANSSIKIIVALLLSLLPLILNYSIPGFNKVIIPILLTLVWACMGIVLNKKNNYIFGVPLLISLIQLVKN